MRCREERGMEYVTLDDPIMLASAVDTGTTFFKLILPTPKQAISPCFVRIVP